MIAKTKLVKIGRYSTSTTTTPTSYIKTQNLISSLKQLILFKLVFRFSALNLIFKNSLARFKMSKEALGSSVGQVVGVSLSSDEDELYNKFKILSSSSPDLDTKITKIVSNSNSKDLRQNSKNRNSIFISKELKSVLISLLTILVYYCFSICLTFYNRYLFVTYKYPLSITVIHLIVKFTLSTLIRNVLDIVNFFSFSKNSKLRKRRIMLDWSTYLTRIIPTAVASAADIGLSNWSLQYITVTLYTISIITVVSCIAFGLFLFTYHSTEFHLFGFTLVMIASFTAGLRWTLAQVITQKHELGLSNPIDMIYHIQPCMILCLLPLAVYVEGLSIITTDKFFRSDDLANIGTNLLWILCGACLAFFLESSEFLVVTFTSSLTLSISGIFKEICIVYLAVVWNHNKLNTMNTIGLSICIIGISIHVFVKARQEAEIIKNETSKVKTKSMFKFPNDDYSQLIDDGSDTDSYLSKSLNYKNKNKNDLILLTHQAKPLLSDTN